MDVGVADRRRHEIIAESKFGGELSSERHACQEGIRSLVEH